MSSANTEPVAGLREWVGLDVPGLPVLRAAIVQTTNEFGLGLGVALLGTLGTAVYRGNVEGALGTCGTRRAAKAR